TAEWGEDTATVSGSVAGLNLEGQIHLTKDSVQVRVKDPGMYQAMVESYVRGLLEQCLASPAEDAESSRSAATAVPEEENTDDPRPERHALRIVRTAPRNAGSDDALEGGRDVSQRRPTTALRSAPTGAWVGSGI